MTLRALKIVSPVGERSIESWDWAAARAHCLREARRILASPAAAEDAAQEALLRAWRASARHEIRNPQAWLTRIARNEAMRAAVREAGLARRRTGAWDGELPAAPDEESAGVADRLAASAAIASLPLGDREVLHLRYLEDLTQMEVAHRLGIPEAQLRSASIAPESDSRQN
ncbi:MAG TPA: sigma-70 family RNA polymerase sigma factor [Thermoleophilaceae bacterium]|nr:sigma-70 family RNA polymerase sigma factor [Thermoleophilaceae bacterium]